MSTYFYIRSAIIATVLAFGSLVQADTAIGDWGHFISYTPTVYLLNTDGRAFDVRVHVMQWGTRDWLRENLTLQLTDPKGAILADGGHALTNSAVDLHVPAGSPGVFQLHTKDNVWVESSLHQSVVWTGEPGIHLKDEESVPDPAGGKPRKREYYEKRGQLVFQASVPRRWWFWVPADTTTFRCTAMRADRCMSQREDWGFFVISPRGQRIRALWGQPPHTSRTDYRQNQSTTVEVEPGAAGRFWCLEVSLGDSHQYSNINIALEGVPPFLARSPEEWFDPRTGTVPRIGLYDETPFIQSAPLPGMEKRWPTLQHFSPCPSLGDPDGIEILEDARFALWNPEGRSLGFRVGTYLPRNGMKSEPNRARVLVTRANGSVVLDKEEEMRHIHGKDGGPTDVLKTGRGVVFVNVSGVERWMSFTYPATPLVLIGEENGEWKRFRFTACAPRNWYFYVPVGTRQFSVRLKADIASDVVHAEICAPDRVVGLIYGNSGEQNVTIPEGLDGKIWYLRPSVGSATLMRTETPPYRYQDLSLTLELKGVPGYLSPTWEQWFDPSAPRVPNERK
jgi:hypothetical protein